MSERPETRRRYKQLGREYIRLYKKSHSCETCGEARAICLDFHHRDPEYKQFSLSDAESRSIESIASEIRKCILLCANCHRVIHAEDIMTGAIKAKTIEEV